jgi:RNA polymerase sigma factor (TIGR02999 family)
MPSFHDTHWTSYPVAVPIRHFSASSARRNASDTRLTDMASTVTAAVVHAETDLLFSTLYAELHRLARRQLARQWTPARLGTTTLLHEAYLNLANGSPPSFPDRAHFMAYAARVMRGLIIDHARAESAIKKGGSFHITVMTLDRLEDVIDVRELSLISDALEELTLIEPELATIVDLKFFCGFSFSEIAAMRETSERTVQRKWEKARIYLHRTLTGAVQP